MEKSSNRKNNKGIYKQKNESAKKDIVIIGAGPAGLTAAYEILKNSNDYNVIILEKDNMVGGISKTVQFNGYRVDTGIHRFFSKSDEINKIWNEILPIQSKQSYDDIILNNNKELPKNGSDPETEELSMLIRDRLTRIYYDKKFFDYPVSINLNLIKNLGFINIMKVVFSYLKTLFYKLPETSLENYYINRFGKVLYSMFFKNYTEKVWGIAPSKISADWGAQRVKGVSIIAIIKDFINKKLNRKNNKNTETSLIEKFYYPKLGSGQMWQEMANKIISLGGKIELNCDVKKINIESKTIKSVEYIKDEINYVLDCKFCISSMPIKDLFEGISKDRVNEKIYSSAVNLPYREFMSVALVVDKLKLKNTTKVKTINNVIPDSWIYIQESEVKMGRLQVFNNWSAYLFKNKEDIKDKVLITLEYFCSENDKYWNMTDDEFINFAIDEAIKINIIDSKDSIIQSYRIKVEKAYPAYFGTYEYIDKIVSYLDKYNNLICIGRNGQHRYNNMDHSMMTGIKAAEYILDGAKDKALKRDIWNVNIEKEYHEEK